MEIGPPAADPYLPAMVPVDLPEDLPLIRKDPVVCRGPQGLPVRRRVSAVTHVDRGRDTRVFAEPEAPILVGGRTPAQLRDRPFARSPTPEGISPPWRTLALSAGSPAGGMIMKIYVRERMKVGEGVRQPRYIILAVAGGDLKVYAHHFRKTELEQIASDLGADLVYLAPMADAERGKKKQT